MQGKNDKNSCPFQMDDKNSRVNPIGIPGVILEISSTHSQN